MSSKGPLYSIVRTSGANGDTDNSESFPRLSEEKLTTMERKRIGRQTSRNALETTDALRRVDVLSCVSVYMHSTMLSRISRGRIVRRSVPVPVALEESVIGQDCVSSGMMCQLIYKKEILGLKAKI